MAALVSTRLGDWSSAAVDGGVSGVDATIIPKSL